jgi:hypothetical protein
MSATVWSGLEAEQAFTRAARARRRASRVCRVRRDGHHRVSVAKARGALTINGIVDAG